MDGPTDAAASTNARAVIDFDPGRLTVLCTGAEAVGAIQGTGLCVTRVSLPVTKVQGMCGRYATTRTAPDLSALFAAFDDTGDELAPDYNLAPTDPAPIVRIDEQDQRRVLSVARWGLVPSWAESPRVGARMINARAETVATARAFARSFASKRCLVPADGWFEWVEKKPFYMTQPGGFAFAGLWTRNRFGLTCSIVTTEATGQLKRVHHRMPLLLQPSRWEEWLAGPADPAVLLAPTDPEAVAAIELRPVGAAVGNVKNDGPGLIVRLASRTEQEGLF